MMTITSQVMSHDFGQIVVNRKKPSPQGTKKKEGIFTIEHWRCTMNFACSPRSIATSHQSAEGADGCLCSSGAFKTCKTSKRLCYEAECLCVCAKLHW